MGRDRWGRYAERPSLIVRNGFLRLVVMPLFALGLLGAGVYLLVQAAIERSFRDLVWGFTFTTIGLMTSAGALMMEDRFGSGRLPMPDFLRPRFRTRSARGRSTGPGDMRQ